MSDRIVQGYVDPQSGQKCGWANGTLSCSVPWCQFAEERCILVQRERQRKLERERQRQEEVPA